MVPWWEQVAREAWWLRRMHSEHFSVITSLAHGPKSIKIASFSLQVLHLCLPPGHAVTARPRTWPCGSSQWAAGVKIYIVLNSAHCKRGDFPRQSQEAIRKEKWVPVDQMMIDVCFNRAVKGEQDLCAYKSVVVFKECWEGNFPASTFPTPRQIPSLWSF